MTRHMESTHPTEFGMSTSQTQIRGTTSSSETGTPSLFKFDKGRYEDACARYCAMEKQPFNYADRITYEASYKEGLGPNASKVARTQMLKRIRRQCMEKQKDLMKYLQRLGHKVSICADVWTDAYNRASYMGITCHWIDAKWTLQKRLIAFREFEEPHTAQNIALIIITVLNEYGLINKVFSVGFDNATANTASIPQLIEACAPSFDGKYFHSKCICHILNLCVQDAIHIFQESVVPIKNAVKYLHKSKALGKKWQKYYRSKNIVYTCFKVDVSHRWNSTYEMLNSTMEYNGHLCDFFRKEFSTAQLVLNESHWDACYDLYGLLKVFHMATKQLSGVYYCTSAKVLEHCMYIAMSFKVCFTRSNLQGVIYFMVQKWLKYFREIPKVFLIAKCLDPKWRYEGVCQMLQIYYDAFLQMDFSNVVIDGEQIFFDLPNVQDMKDDLHRTLIELFDEYRRKYGSNEDNTEISSSFTMMPSFDFPFDMDSMDPLVRQMQVMYQNRTYDNPRSQGNSELDIFLQTRFVFGVGDSGLSINVLKWWSKRVEYTILSMMVMELFAVPASTVSFEQAFSTGSLMLDQRRSTMQPANIEATMLLDDWCRADLRAQEPEWDDWNESEAEAFTETDRSASASGAEYEPLCCNNNYVDFDSSIK